MKSTLGEEWSEGGDFRKRGKRRGYGEKLQLGTSVQVTVLYVCVWVWRRTRRERKGRGVVNEVVKVVERGGGEGKRRKTGLIFGCRLSIVGLFGT